MKKLGYLILRGLSYIHAPFKGFENYTIQAKTSLIWFQMSVVQQMVSDHHLTI